MPQNAIDLAPLCAHFGTCGGCAHQDMAPHDYRALKRDMVIKALARQGFADAAVEETIEVAPATRRRAVFKVEKLSGAVKIGFHAARSHDIVDMRECRVLTPRLFALVAGLRDMMTELLREAETAELHVTDTDAGFDVSIDWKRANDPATNATVARLASKLKLARLTAKGHTLIEVAQPSARFGKAVVKFPPDAFLQPTREGEAALQARVLAAMKGAKHIADLFAGLGTFALPLAEQAQVHAVEREGPMLDALAAAVRATQGLKPVTTEARDLFKQPLTARELEGFDAVVLDPPRAGAQAQAVQLAQSRIKRIAYVSCDPASFARDARILVDGGYRMGAVVPVDQFLWSSHIELVAAFAKK
jgi:23S rRNA (uracil1939-C5)-methyltransferase